LTVTDDGGFTYSTSRQVEVTTPPPPPPPIPTPPPTPRPAAPGIAVAAAKAKVKNGVALLKLTCKGGPCSGVVKLLDRGPIGHARFSIGAGKSIVLHVKLTRAGIVLLDGAGGPLKVSLSGTGVRHRSVALTPAG
jgi:hypothetical protein